MYSYPHNDTVKILDIARKSKSVHEPEFVNLVVTSHHVVEEIGFQNIM